MKLKNIEQKATLAASAAELYHAYLSPKAHGEIIGDSVSITASGAFRAFNGMLSGKILHRVPGKLIVQTWRSKGWKSSDPDSILVLRFIDTKKGGQILLSHTGVPKFDHKDIVKGWKRYYWRPWKAHLKSLGAAKVKKGRSKKSSKAMARKRSRTSRSR